MKKALIIVCVILIVLSGCASAKYHEYLDKGRNALEEKNYEDAVSYFEKAVKEKSEKEAKQLLDESITLLNVHHQFEKGSTALQEKKYDDAMAKFKEIIERNDSNKELVHIMDNVKASLKKAKKQKEKSLFEMASTSLKGKEYNTAIKNYTEVIELNPNNKEAKDLLKYSENMKNGTEALNNEKYDEAISLFSIALNSKPNDDEAIKRKDEALNYKRELESTTPIPDVVPDKETLVEDNLDDIEELYETNIVVEEQDDAIVEFVNSMNYWMNNYNQNVLSQIQGINNNMTTPSYLMAKLGSIYRESVNLFVPNPEYQSIVDNWLKCLEATNSLLEVFDELSKGNTDALNTDIIDEVYHYLELTENGLHSIQ